MRNRFAVAMLTLAAAALGALTAASQPPEGGGRPEGRRDGPPRDRPPRFELGRVLPPFAREQLKLTRKQEEEIAKLEKEVKQRLEKILTAEQRKALESLRPPDPGGPRPGGPGRREGRGGPQDRREPPERPEQARLTERADHAEQPPNGLVKNPRFTEAGQNAKTPAHYILQGATEWVEVGKRGENAGRGIAFHSGKGVYGARAGSVAQDVTGFEGRTGKWFRFSFRGLAEKNFAVQNDGLFMKVDFYSHQGAEHLDGVTRRLYPLVERDRKELAANGNHHQNGGAVWKTYALEFKLPFAEIDRLCLSVGFRNGSSTAENEAVFYMTEFALTPIAAPISTAQAPGSKHEEPPLERLIHLGGRWYYDPEPDMKGKPAKLTVTAKNADRLYYKDNRLTNPFAENMTAWLRKGYKDLDGRVVREDRFLGDNVVLEFNDDKTMIVHARNIPNHPTAQFPETLGGFGRNPHYIQEKDSTYYLRLNPVRNPKAAAMDKANANRALPMGPTGIAINGVVFFNPFDAGMRDATDIMDRCCGHPSPDNRYHYHKYPVCVKSPFVDEGEEHSPLIGWAFDGFPIYGPYESKGVMARDSKDNPLNEFNLHYDEARGWHYHVTPGQFPYVIGGYWGEVDARNLARGGPRPR